MLGGLRVTLPPSSTCDTGVACRRIGCGFRPSADFGFGFRPSTDSGFVFRPSDDSGFAFWPSDNPGFACCPSAYPGFALWPFRAVFRPQMDRGRTLVARMDRTRTLDALRCSRWPKPEPGMRGCSPERQKPEPWMWLQSQMAKTRTLGAGSDRAVGSRPQPRSGQWAAAAQGAVGCSRAAGCDRVVPGERSAWAFDADLVMGVWYGSRCERAPYLSVRRR